MDNLKHGKGIQIWKHNGAIYSGDWKFGKRDGYGSYSIPDPVTKEYLKVYTGWWRNNKECIELADPDGVLAEAQVMFDDSQNE